MYAKLIIHMQLKKLKTSSWHMNITILNMTAVRK